MSVTITKLNIPKAKLAAIPDDERSLFFMLGHISNEQSSLRRLLIFAIQYQHPEPGRDSAHISQAMMLARILGGKCWEAWEYVNDEIIQAKVDAAYEKLLPDEGKDALAKLKEKFAETHLLGRLRNQFAFHYLRGKGAKQINASFAEWADAHAEIFTAGNRINTLCYISEVLLNHAMLQTIDRKDLAAAMDKLMVEIIDVSDLLSTFSEQMMWTIGRRYMPEDHGIESREDFEFKDAPNLYDVRLPVYVSTPADGEGQA